MSDTGHAPVHHWSVGKTSPTTLAECAEMAAYHAKQVAPAIQRRQSWEAARDNYDPKPEHEQAREIAKGRKR